MREFTPPPPPPPGSPPPEPPLQVTLNASIRMQPASGEAGGTVVAWASLDNSGPVVVRIAGEMDAAWNSVPLYVNQGGNYLFLVWHPGVELAPPASNPPLGPKDSALLAALEENLPAMNLEVANSAARARNAPPPPPPVPGSRRFWRIFVDANADTDADGSPDWAEFEIAARGAGVLVSGVTADPFAADTNADGIPDGDQLDADGDGTPDAKDPDVADDTAAFPIGPEPRYAVFPIANIPPSVQGGLPIQISDKGTVMYEHATWRAGNWTDLAFPVSADSWFVARSINDNDIILGAGNFVVQEDPEVVAYGICAWESPSSTPAFISAIGNGTQVFASPTQDFVYSTTGSRSVLGNDGCFLMPTWGWKDDKFEYLHFGSWKLPENGGAAAEAAAPPGMTRLRDANLMWGHQTDANGSWTDKGSIRAPGPLPQLPFVPENVLAWPGAPVIALPGEDDGNSALAFVGGVWKPSEAYAEAIDMSKDGTAISRSRPGMGAQLSINGKWNGFERVAPGTAGGWEDTRVRYIDTTPGGWILAERGDTIPAEHAAMLPIRIDGIDPDYAAPPPDQNGHQPEPPEFLAGGVDRISMTADGGSGRLPEIWVMAPNGGEENKVRFRSPLNAVSQLPLISDGGSDPNVTFTPAKLSLNDVQVRFSGQKPDTRDVAVTLRLGENLDALNVPLKIKAMKKRTVRIALHQVFGIDFMGIRTQPEHMPDRVELENYLNRVYGRQVNATFVVYKFDEEGPHRPHPGEQGIDFDLDNNGELFVGGENDEVLAATPNAKLGRAPWMCAIDIWVVGGVTMNFLDENFVNRRAVGVKLGNESRILIDGDVDRLQGLPEENKQEHVMHTIAHEIGHVMTDDGHPGEPFHKATLTYHSGRDPNSKKRLMCSGFEDDDKNPGTCLIKKEWDRIDAWLEIEEAAGRVSGF